MIGSWLLVSALCSVLAFAVFGKLSDRGYAVPGSDSARAASILEHRIPGRDGVELFAVVTRRHPVSDWRDRAPRVVRAALAGQEEVGHVKYESSSISYRGDSSTPSAGVVTVAIPLHVDAAAAEKLVPALRSRLDRAADRSTSISLTGGPVVSERYSSIAHHDLELAELAALPVILLVLLVAFQAVVAALLPLVLAGVTLLVTFASLDVIGSRIGLSIFVTNTATVLALGLSIDFSLFLITRFREELASGSTSDDALVTTMTTTGRAVLLSAVTIATSLVGLVVVGIDVFSSMAIAATVVTVLAASAALTLLPALICLLGDRVEGLRLGRVARAAARGTLWSALARSVTSHAALAAAASLAVLLVLAIPAGSYRLSFQTVQALPKHEPVRRASVSLGGPTTVVTRDTIARVGALVSRDPAVQQIWDPTRGSAGWSSMLVILRDPPDSVASRHAVGRLRAVLPQRAGRTYVGGTTAAVIDLTHRITGRTPYAILLTVAFGFLVLVGGLRAVVIPLKAVLSTLLSVAATLGILLRLSGADQLEFFVPLFLFAILFGLSVDYEIFLLSRIREAAVAGHDNREAVRRGLVGSARSISLAGLTLIIVFAAFATSSLGPFQQLGTGLAIAIALDITLVRCVLVPATVVLLRQWNWWFPGAERLGARSAAPADSSRATRSGSHASRPFRARLGD